MIVKGFSSFFLIFLCFALSAQNQVHEIRGKVLSESGAPIEFATIKLLKAIDSTLINAMYADEQGQFKFNAVNCQETYILKLSNIGYTTKHLPPFKSTSCTTHDYGPIQLSLDVTLDLEEVKVRGQLDVLKAGYDKKVYNVGEVISV